MLLNLARAFRNKIRPPVKRHIGQQTSDWYNKEFQETHEYHQHYTETNYYFLWAVVADRILRSGVTSLIDIGCGPGQFASLLRDNGFTGYTGVDFSAERIAHAQHLCPGYEFIVSDMENSSVLIDRNYDSLLTMEFLEHVEFDLGVIHQIRPGTKVWATVPNFPYVSHVRHFRDALEVNDRYGRFFSGLRVNTFLENPAGKTFFLMEGVKS